MNTYEVVFHLSNGKTVNHSMEGVTVSDLRKGWDQEIKEAIDNKTMLVIEDGLSVLPTHITHINVIREYQE